MKINETIRTSGNGLWSNESREVNIVRVEYDRFSEDSDGDVFGEVRVYFTKASWNPKKHGLIYTDPMFIRELRTVLKEYGLRGVVNLDYSEQGMQGDNYVSLDITGIQFDNSWARING